MGGSSRGTGFIVGIKDKQTYGEYYWAMQVEAAKALAEDTEKELSTVASRLMNRIGIKDVLPPELSDLFNEIEAPAGAFLGEVGGRFLSEVADGAVSKTTSPLLESIGYLSYMKWPTKKLSTASTAQLYSRNRISEDFFLERFRMGGFEPVEAQFQYESQLPYPSVAEIIRYSRYHGEPDAPWSMFQEWYNISPREWPIFEWLTRQQITTEQAHTMYRRGIIPESGYFDITSRIGWDSWDRTYLEKIGWTIPNAMLMVQGALQQGRPHKTVLSDISKADIHPDYAQQYLDAVLTKPASIDVVNYSLRIDTDLSGLDNRLQKIGIHPEYTALYKELAYQIPPVADIITMAVREAFSPSIAAKFGQYEDFPDELAEWGAKKGLSEDWTKRYWAAHWSLPSPQQGFEMLHRGIINAEELKLLLRALDVMPFWRDRLVQMSYRRLTRVDVRRMYRQGVLDETEVLEAYLQHGYAPENAQRMTEFTIKQTLSTMSKFTTSDIVAAYTKQMISKSEASSLLDMLGVRYADRNYILSTAEYKRVWALTEQKITAIRNMYRKRVYDENQTRDKLSRLDLPADRINVLMEQWYYDIEADDKPTWTTVQTLRFIKTKLITRSRGIQELKAIGYDDEHINVYLESIK